MPPSWLAGAPTRRAASAWCTSTTPARPSSPRPCAQAVRDHLELEHELGGYEAAEAREGALREAYDAVGRLLGASGRNVAMQQNSTVAFTQAFARLRPPPRRSDPHQPGRLRLQPDPVPGARRVGVGVEVVRAPDAPEGGIDPQAVREMVRRRPRTLLALSWIPTNSGLVQPAEAIGRDLPRGGGALHRWTPARPWARSR